MWCPSEDLSNCDIFILFVIFFFCFVLLVPDWMELRHGAKPIYVVGSHGKLSSV